MNNTWIAHGLWIFWPQKGAEARKKSNRENGMLLIKGLRHLHLKN